MRSNVAKSSTKSTTSAKSSEGEHLGSFKFQVSGKVQGVFFRKYTQVDGMARVRECMHILLIYVLHAENCKIFGAGRMGHEYRPRFPFLICCHMIPVLLKFVRYLGVRFLGRAGTVIGEAQGSADKLVQLERFVAHLSSKKIESSQPFR